MKTIADFAKEVGKSTTSIYRALNAVEQETEKCLTVLNSNIKQISDEGLEILRDRFNSVQHPVQQTSNTVECTLNDVEHPKSDEIVFLRDQIQHLQEELQSERKHSQGLANKLADLNLVEKQIELAKLTAGTQQPALLDAGRDGSEPQPSQKRNFFSRIFHP